MSRWWHCWQDSRNIGEDGVVLVKMVTLLVRKWKYWSKWWYCLQDSGSICQDGSSVDQVGGTAGKIVEVLVKMVALLAR